MRFSHPRQRRLVLFLLLALCCRFGDALAAAAAAVAPASSPSSSSCSAVASCGGRINITYPFHLSTAGGDGGGGAFCGYPGLGLDCVDGNTTVLRLSTNNNTVFAINYPTRTMFVVDSDVHRAAAADGCPRVVERNVTLAPGSRLQFTTSDASLTFLIGCGGGRGVLPSRCLDGSTPVGCDLGGGGGSSSYVFRGAVAGTPAVSEDCARLCSSMVTMPVYGALFDVPSLANLTTSYGRVLKNGFELSWGTASDARCALCESSGGWCSYNRTSTETTATGAMAFNCVCPDGRTRPTDCGNHTRGRKIKIYVATTASSIGVLLLLVLAYLAHCKRTFGTLIFWRKGSYVSPRVQAFLQRYGSLHPKIYSYLEVKNMTKSFAHKLGEGGCGVVYKGNLPNDDGHSVAVKTLKGSKGDDEQFMNEVASISLTSHVNIVTLLGFCIQGSKRALVYDYMPNGSLARFIFRNNQSSDETTSLSWDKLFEIAIGIARGLEYLHKGCNTRIVHFDIKPHNILLDENFCPKISDFGLAKLCTQKETTVSIGVVRGTIGYIAPEVFSKQFGVVSSKSDVYSYGMMILEMVSSTRNTCRSSSITSVSWGSDTDEFYFPCWIYENLDQYCHDVSGMVVQAEELVRKMIIVGLWCIQVMPIDRPSISRVIEMLENDLKDLSLPSKLMSSFLANQETDP